MVDEDGFLIYDGTVTSDDATLQRTEVDFYVCCGVNVVLTLYLGWRSSFSTMWVVAPGAPFYVGFFLGLSATTSGWLSMACRIPGRLALSSPVLRRCRAWALAHKTHRGSGVGLDDVYVIALTACLGMYFVARALAGPCPDNVSVWNSQECNPQGAVHLLPLDTYVIVMLAPLLAHTVCSDATKTAVNTAWAVAIVLFNVAHYIVGASSENYVWINVTFNFFIYATYESERKFGDRLQLKDAALRSRMMQDRLSVELHEAKLAAAELEMASKRSMVRYMSQAIRSPLNNVVGCLEVINQELKKAGVTLPPGIFDLLIQCREGCESARNVVLKLVSFDKIAAGQEKLELAVVPVLDYIHTIAQPFISQARAKNVDMTMESSHCDERTSVAIDPVKMAQVFRQFFANAVKVSRERRKVLVKVRGDGLGDGAGKAMTVLVIDQGPGLVKEEIDRLFRRDVALDVDNHRGGAVHHSTGLGLFIARGIVDLHAGASCGATSDGLGHGCTFYVTIPCVEDTHTGSGRPGAGSMSSRRGGVSASSRPGVASASGRPSAMSASRRPSIVSVRSFRPMALSLLPPEALQALTILVVDDSVVPRKMVVRALERLQQRCYEAGDGLAALTLVRQSLIARDAGAVANTSDDLVVYDAVCMDNRMPHMNGPDAAEQMRLAGFEGPIIGFCGGGDAHQDFLDAGADLVLTKPVSGPLVLKAIADATTLRAAQAAAAAETYPSIDAEMAVAGLSIRRTFSPAPESTLRGRNNTATGVAESTLRGRNNTSAGVSDPTPRGRNNTATGVANRRGSVSRRMPTLSPSRKRHARAAAAFHSVGDPDENGDRLGPAPPLWRMRAVAVRRSVRVRDVVSALPPPLPRRPESLPLALPAAPEVPPPAPAEMMRAESGVMLLDDAAVVRWEDLVTYFLAFKCPEHRTEQVRAAFDEFRRAQLNFKLGALLLVLALVWVFTRSNFASFWAHNAVFPVAFTVAMLCGPIILLSWFMRLAVISWRYDVVWFQPYHDWAISITKSTYHGWCENAVIVLVPLQASLFVLARAIQGACPPGTTVWNTQMCNTDGVELPMDALLFAVVCLLKCPAFVLGGSYRAMAASWVMTVAVLNAAMVLSGSNLILWVNLALLICAALMYERERGVAVTFAKMLVLLAAKDEANKRNVDNRVRLALTDERDAARASRDAMQATVSKTGHDLKSPITAMGMALEAVMHDLQGGGRGGGGGGGGGVSSCGGGDATQARPANTRSRTPRLTSLREPCAEAYAALLHIKLIVNRSQDYTALLAGSPLVPSVQPVDALSTMRFVAHWKSLTSDVPVEIAPPPAGFVAVGVTDLSWLKDNLLCVVDNACKFTRRGSGAVTLTAKSVVFLGRKALEISVHDRSDAVLSDAQLRALFDRPVDFRRDAVGGMGTGMYCLAARVKALGPGGACGARRRTDRVPGNEVWMRLPFEPPTGTARVDLSALSLSLVPSPNTRGEAEAEVFAAKDLQGCLPSRASSRVGVVADDVAAPAQPAASAAAAVVAVAVLAGAQSPAATDHDAALAPLAGLHVLVVDDSAPIRKVMERMLVAAGAAVQTAKDGEEAVEMVQATTETVAGAGLQATPYDIVVTDIQMPRKDGWAASMAIRALPHCSPRELVIVGMSAQGGGDMEPRWRAAGMDGFMAKPFGLAKLVDMLASRGGRRGRGEAGTGADEAGASCSRPIA